MKKGICAGYSYLFKYMLMQIGIESVVIGGYGRGDINTVYLEDVNHAWNAIKLGNEWNLYDVTWARGSISGKVDNIWFKTPPELFILSHYPEDLKWTLLENNFSLTEFYNFPVFSPSFYDVVLPFQLPLKGYFIAKEDTIKIDVKVGGDNILLPKLFDTQNHSWISPEIINETHKTGVLAIILHKKGYYILSMDIILQDEDTMTMYNEFVCYKLINM